MYISNIILPIMYILILSTLGTTYNKRCDIIHYIHYTLYLIHIAIILQVK